MTEKKKNPAKRGRASQEEISFINSNPDMTTDQIADILGRTPMFVARFRNQEIVREVKDEDRDYIEELREKHFWAQTKKNLTKLEIDFFEEQWSRLMRQFETTGIMETDELMMKDYIILEIAFNRALSTKNKTMIRINELERQLAKEKNKRKENPSNIASINEELSALRSAIGSMDKHILEYQTRKDSKLRDLKGTRDQRFKQLEESKKSWQALIKELDAMNNREKEGLWAERMKVASDKVGQDWSEYTQYSDGEIDRPFLEAGEEV
jgi:chromosome segregation ATPase